VYFTVLMSFISLVAILVLTLALIVHFSLHIKVSVKKSVTNFYLMCFWAFDVLKIVLIRPEICKKIQILASIFFSRSYDIEHPK
jgi:hypothetical protein